MVGGEGPGRALTSQVHKLQLLVPGVQIRHLLPLWILSVFSKKSSVLFLFSAFLTYFFTYYFLLLLAKKISRKAI